MVVGIALNIYSYLKYRTYARQRQQAIGELQMSSIHNRPTLNRELEQMNDRKKWERRKINMLYMALTLCSILSGLPAARPRRTHPGTPRTPWADRLQAPRACAWNRIGTLPKCQPVLGNWS